MSVHVVTSTRKEGASPGSIKYLPDLDVGPAAFVVFIQRSAGARRRGPATAGSLSCVSAITASGRAGPTSDGLGPRHGGQTPENSVLGTPSDRPGPHRVAPVDIPPLGRIDTPDAARADGAVLGPLGEEMPTVGCPAVIGTDGPTITGADKFRGLEPVVVTGPTGAMDEVPACPERAEPSVAMPEETAPPAVAVPPMPGVMTTGFAKPGSVVVEGVVAEPMGCAHGVTSGTVILTATRIAVLRFMPRCPLWVFDQTIWSEG
jgi:hypothetical protein